MATTTTKTMTTMPAAAPAIHATDSDSQPASTEVVPPVEFIPPVEVVAAHGLSAAYGKQQVSAVAN